MSAKRVIYLILGCISLVLGCVGAVLPLLPTVPFLLLTAYCFARSSQRLNNWFRGTKLYKEHLESYVQKKGMTMRTKMTILGSVSLLMGIGFVMMSRVPVGRIVLAIVWGVHVIYFLFGVKTIS